jgi:hypothetical protein
MPHAYHPTTSDGQIVAYQNDSKVLRVLRLFGHLRREEIAMAVWPSSSPKSAYMMAFRTTNRLVEKKMILVKDNTLGGKSYVLAAKGVARLRDMDLPAQEGYELAYDGPQFFHRTLGTCYLLEKARMGSEVFGEYALLKGFAPTNKDFLNLKYNKLPDGMIVYASETMGYQDGLRGADWIEVESAYKPYDELRKALLLLTKNSELNTARSLNLAKLVFVYDSRQAHDRQILRAIKTFLKEKPELSPEHFLPEIVLAKCYIDPPLVWRGMEETSADVLLRDDNLGLNDHDLNPL